MTSKRLPRLRAGLDIFPSPIEERPGLLMRDPFRYSEEILIIPPLLARGLIYFDGEQTELDLQAYLSRLTGEIIPHEVIESMVSALNGSGFLETPEFEKLRELRHAQFSAADARIPAHAGSAYPDEADSLRLRLDEKLNHGRAGSPAGRDRRIIGLAAPHVSPDGGWSCYASAYNRLNDGLGEQLSGKTIVVLGTSHYGAPERFGLTRKPFLTPFGKIEVDTQLVDWLCSKAKDSIILEDYCHAIEHSIEFQTLFLHYKLGGDFKILPILCGPFAKAILEGEAPEDDERVRRFLDALGEMADAHRDRLFWVLGIDLAHIGRRYGDQNPMRAFKGEMLEIKERDEERLERICSGDVRGFYELVHPGRDPLKWCGFSPLYTFLSAVSDATGEVIEYDQWNIDDASVVSFAAMEFSR